MATPANTSPLTVQYLLDSIHVAYEQATDTPALTDDDGKIRLNLINKGIARWEYENGIRWRELWTYNQTAPAITLNSPVILLSQSDFRELGSRIRFLRTNGSRFYVDVVSPEMYARHVNESRQVVSLSGNPADGYQLNLGWIPAAADGTVGAVPYFDYYRNASLMISVNDTPQMSNPWFLVDYVTGELFANDDPNLFEKFNGDALAKLSNMQEENEAMPAYASQAVEDQAGDNRYAFGI